jgi:allophanate hydrolase
MSEAVFSVSAVGPHVSIQDAGRVGFMRFGVPASGPMDRISFTAANTALGNAGDLPCIEVSLASLALECLAGAVTFAVAGGGFVVEHAGRRTGSWTIATIRAGERLAIRPGPWGSWTYLAFAGRLIAERWLGSASTHALSGLGGGRLASGQRLTILEAEVREEREGDIPCPVTARPRSELHVVLGPQERFFSPESIAAFLTGPYRLTDSYDRMGVRLHGPAVAPHGPLDMPSEPIMRGSVQVAGDGVPTLLLADHQTTGGYPKIATVVDADLDAFVQLRARDPVAFRAITPEQAVERARRRSAAADRYIAAIAKPQRNATQRLMGESLVSGVVDGSGSAGLARPQA